MRMTKKYKFVLAFLLAIAAIAVLFAAYKIQIKSTNENTTAQESRTEQAVQLKQVKDILIENAKIELIAKVESQNEASLRAERSGTITAVYTGAGKFASAQSIIARIENSAEAAAVQSAKAGIQSAKAGIAQAQAMYNKISGGTREQQLSILKSSLEQSESSLDEAINSSKNTLSSIYSSTASSITYSVDLMFTDADGINPKINFQTNNFAQKTNVENARLSLQRLITKHKNLSLNIPTLSSKEETLKALNAVERDLQSETIFLNNLLIAINSAIPSPSTTAILINGYKASAEGAKKSADALLKSVSASRNAINGASTAVKIAKENQEQGTIGAQDEDVESAAAGLSQARAGLSAAYAGLASAQAQYEKTLIRSPISGTIMNLSIKKGDFVNMFQELGTVANENATQLTLHSTADDIKNVHIGSKVLIENTYHGTVINISSGLDNLHKQLEIKILVDDKSAKLVHGDSVSVSFIKNEKDSHREDNQDILLNLSSIKFSSNDSFVLSVSEDGEIIKKKIEIGEIIGSAIEIKSGLSFDDYIITDARGLRIGQKVHVLNK